MEIPQNILSIIERINKNERNWKVRYYPFWESSYKLRTEFEKTPQWDKKIITVNLPSFNEQLTFTPKELEQELTSNDITFTFEHLIILFAIFEELLKEVCPSILNETRKKSLINKFFEKENKEILNGKELEEVILAKETRNCYVHNGGKINNRWKTAYENAKGKLILNKEGDNILEEFPNNKFYHQVEEWHSLIVEITNKIKAKLETPPQPKS